MAFAQFPVTDTWSGTLGSPLNSNWTSVTPAKAGCITQGSGAVVSTQDTCSATYTGVPFLGPGEVVTGVLGPDWTVDEDICVNTNNTTGGGYCWNAYDNKVYKMTVVSGGTNPSRGTSILSCSTWNPGDTLKLSITSAGVITCSDVTLANSATVTDTTFPSGQPGIFLNYATHTIIGPFTADCFPTSCSYLLAPTSSSASGYYPTAPTLTLSAASGATICVRTDGTNPAATTPGTCDAGSTTYAGGAISLPSGVITSVKALATKAGKANSTVASFSYTIGYIPPTLNGVQIFPTNSIFNTRIDALPIDTVNNSSFQTTFGAAHIVHNWDQGATVGVSGIPWNAATSATPQYTVTSWFFGESDNGPYYILDNTNIENIGTTGCTNTSVLDQNTDYHNLTVVNLGGGAGQLQEMYQASCVAGSPNVWSGDSGAIWDLTSNNLRTNTFTSADVAGLPITPFLVKYDEAASGVINHPSRLTVHSGSNTAFVWPARHAGGSGGLPWGLRLRLNASFDVSGFSAINQVILNSWKQYGIFIADNGNSGYVQGVTDPRWNEADLDTLNAVTLSNFEVVDESACQISADSGQSSCGAASVSTTVYGAAHFFGLGSKVY